MFSAANRSWNWMYLLLLFSVFFLFSFFDAGLNSKLKFSKDYHSASITLSARKTLRSRVWPGDKFRFERGSNRSKRDNRSLTLP